MKQRVNRQTADAVLLLAFGGPTRPEEIRPFLKRVMEGRPFADAQLEEIAHHYEAVGGKSPMNELTHEQGKALQDTFRKRKFSIPVYVGFRHAAPSVAETLERMTSDGIQKAKVIVMTPYQSEASWNRYRRLLQEARHAIGRMSPQIDFVQPWFEHPLFIEAVADRVKEARSALHQGQSSTLLFTAHSIPVKMAEQSPYVDQITTSARLVAEKLNQYRWNVVYQSRSGHPRVSWLAPDICDALRTLAQEGERCVVVVPVGFVCDHVEVLYDLDIEARGVAEEVGIQLIRAKTVGKHPQFIRMMAEFLLQEPVERQHRHEKETLEKI